MRAADIVLASTEDLLPLYPGEGNDALLARIPGREVVLKLSEPAACFVLTAFRIRTRAEPVGRSGRRYHGGR